MLIVILSLLLASQRWKHGYDASAQKFTGWEWQHVGVKEGNRASIILTAFYYYFQEVNSGMGSARMTNSKLLLKIFNIMLMTIFKHVGN